MYGFLPAPRVALLALMGAFCIAPVVAQTGPGGVGDSTIELTQLKAAYVEYRGGVGEEIGEAEEQHGAAEQAAAAG